MSVLILLSAEHNPAFLCCIEEGVARTPALGRCTKRFGGRDKALATGTPGATPAPEKTR